MLFWLKKTISYWMMPLPVCLVLIAAGIVLLILRRRARLGAALAIGSFVLLTLFANKWVSVALIRPLETQYAPIPELTAGAPVPADLAAVRYVVVFGGGNGWAPGVAAVNLLSGSALARVTEAVRILRAVPEATMLVSGPKTGPNPSHATMLGRAAISLGIDPARIRHIEEVRDTEDETIAVKKIAGDARVALVTSAWHMPRTVALARHAGLDALPCPTDYRSDTDSAIFLHDLWWELESLERSTMAVRERIGYLWIRLRGKT